MMRKRKYPGAEEPVQTKRGGTTRTLPDVEFVGERTREERDAEGRANAVDVDF